MIIVISSTLRGTKLMWIRIVCTVILLICIPLKTSSAEQEGSSSVSMVCPGDNLTLSCCTNGSALQWFVNTSLTPLRLAPGEDGIRLISERSLEMDRPITVNSTVIRFFKISSSPLLSVLAIDNVTTNWNQTMIECTRSMEEISVTVTTIHIIDHTVMMIISDEQFGANNVTVTLGWFQNGIVFNSVLPPASIRSMGNRSVQLTIPYNTEHNVSVAVCGQLSLEVIKLLYIVCDEPTNNDLTVINYTAPALQGSIIAIECDALNVNNYTSTCVEGRWEPSLDQISERCGGGQGVVNIPAASNNSTLISIVISVIVAIIIFFTTGFVYGCTCICQKYKQLIWTLCKTQADQPSTDLNIKHEQEESHNLEMVENVAYGPVGGFQL